MFIYGDDIPMIKFKDLSLPLKIAVIFAYAYAIEFLIYFSIGFFGAIAG